MKRPTLIITLCFAISLGRFATAAPQNVAGDEHSGDRAAVQQTVNNFADAWNKHDAHAFTMTFTEDADFTNVAGAHAQGRADIEAFHASKFADVFKESHLTDQIHSVRFLTPSLAAVDVDWGMTGAKKPDGSPVPPRKGLLNWVMAKQSDESWLILVMHNTELTDKPATPPAK
jgi:uncharacterized protein (TIGR02246 family)